MRKVIDFLRKQREQLNYSQDYVAHQLGVSTSSVSRWETGQSEPLMSKLKQYSKLLGLKDTDLYAILASEENSAPAPIAELRLSIFTEEAYTIIMKAIAEQGLAVSVESKCLNKWT